MSTKELKTKLDQLNPDEKLIVLALGIVLDRLHRLTSEDSEVAFELLQDYAKAETAEDREAAHDGIMEILEAQPVKVAQMPLAEEGEKPDGGLQSWIRWVGGRIKGHRKKAKLTQSDLEEKCGLPQSHISRIENGKLSPSRATLEKIATALNVPLGEFDPEVEQNDCE